MLTPLFLFFFLASPASAQVALSNGASHAGAISPANIRVSSTAPSPLSVTNGLQLWLRADAGATVNANGGVMAWADFSGNSTTQPSVAVRWRHRCFAALATYHNSSHNVCYIQY